MRDVLYIFMVWVFPVIVVGTLFFLAVRRRRRSDADSG